MYQNTLHVATACMLSVKLSVVCGAACVLGCSVFSVFTTGLRSLTSAALEMHWCRLAILGIQRRPFGVLGLPQPSTFLLWVGQTDPLPLHWPTTLLSTLTPGSFPPFPDV